MEQLEGRTRGEILATLLHHGPCSATFLGEHLDLAAAGVRRHLDVLQGEGLIEVASTRSGQSKGRGRPAKTFALTDAGRSHFGHDYDTLAALALEALRETGGDEAVAEFARKRIERIVAGIKPAGSSPESIKETANQLVAAFSRSGYAASSNEAGQGVQICQHHCPISHVAQEFPQLCEAEHRVISELLGQHVQPLATIVGGHGICTTNIPLTPIKRDTNIDPGQGRSGQ